MSRFTSESAKAAQRSLVLMYFVNGFSATAYVPLIPELINQIGVNFVQWGTILGFTGLGALLPLTFTHRLVAQYGTRRVIRIAATLATVMMVLIPFSHNWVTFFVLQVLQTMSFSAFNISINSSSVMLQKKMKKTIVGGMHAAWSIGAASSAFISGLLIPYFSMPVHIGIVGALCVLAYQLAGRKLLGKENDGHTNESARAKKVPWLRTPAFVWLLTAGLFAGVWPEMVMIDWSSVFAKRALLAEGGLIAIPYTCFTVAMIIGRLSIGPITKRIHISEMSKWGGTVGAVMLLLGTLLGPTFAATNPVLGMVVSCVFFGIAGLGVGPMVPSFFTAAGNVMGLTTAQALSRMSMVNMFVTLTAKTIMGALAQQNMQVAFIFPTITLFAAGIISAFVVAKAKRNEDEMLTAFPMTGPIEVSDAD
ncbi:MAG: hypothetical protein RLZZ164_814 [Actinomycetota bacterium]|jgi:MFS family permease